jgi:hypothetical protein
MSDIGMPETGMSEIARSTNAILVQNNISKSVCCLTPLPGRREPSPNTVTLKKSNFFNLSYHPEKVLIHSLHSKVMHFIVCPNF